MKQNYQEEKILRSQHVFAAAKSNLGISYLAEHWKKSHRMIYSWCADTKYCQVHYTNPLEKIILMLLEIKKRGAKDVVEAALHLTAGRLGYQISPLDVPASDKKKSRNILFSQLMIKTGKLAGLFAEHFHKESLEQEEISQIEALINSLKIELSMIQQAMREQINEDSR